MTTYYVDGDVGNDGNAGTSEGSGNAWATIQHAADTATAGDTVYIKASSTYTEDVDLDTNVGTAGSPIIFEGYTTTPGDHGQATIDGENSRAHCISWSQTSEAHISLRNLILTGATAYCIDITEGFDYFELSNITFTDGSGSPSGAFGRSSGYNTVFYTSFVDCVFENMSGSGISFISSGSIFNNCRFQGNGAHGALTNSYSDAFVFTNCQFIKNLQDGLNLATDSNRVHIVGNIFADNGNGGTGSGFVISGRNHRNVLITENIFANHSGVSEYGIECGTLSGTTRISHGRNAYYNNNTDKHSNLPSVFAPDISLSADPFDNAASDDYNLNTASGGGQDLREVEVAT